MIARKRAAESGTVRGFEKGRNAGTKKCSECGETTWKSAGDGTDASLCNGCYEAAGIENAHSDGRHETPEAACPLCMATVPR